MNKKTPVASVTSNGPVTLGISDTIRWGDIVTVNGYEVDITKAVELAKENELWIADILERDLKSDDGLLIMFPIAMLMSKLQELPHIETGERLLELVKPDYEEDMQRTAEVLDMIQD